LTEEIKRIKVWKKGISGACELCKREEVAEYVLVFQSGSVFIVCERCLECLKFLIDLGVLNVKIEE